MVNLLALFLKINVKILSASDLLLTLQIATIASTICCSTVDKNTFARYLRQYQTNDVVKEKRRKRKQRKLGGRKEEYHLTKKAAIRAVYNAKQHTQSEYF